MVLGAENLITKFKSPVIRWTINNGLCYFQCALFQVGEKALFSLKLQLGLGLT